jgi:UDP-glucose:(heptosyl)LPS alpha-1,3-glucosyltransferase
MKIAIIRQRYNQFGGAERFVARAVEALAAGNSDVTIVTREWRSGGSAAGLVLNPFYFGSVWRDWSFARAVRRELPRQRFDIVQSHERIPGADIFRAGDGVHCEWLTQRRRALGRLGRLGLCLNPYHHYTLHAERRVFTDPRLAAVICISRMVRDEVQRHFGLALERLPVIPPGVDTTTYSPQLRALHREQTRRQWNIPAAAFVFVFVGAGFARKGVANLLRAARGVDAYFLIVGSDKHLRRYQQLAASELGTASARVLFTGPQHDVKPFLGAADAFVLPAIYEPFSNAALEAMAAGLPAILSRQCGAAELIDEGKNGHVVDALDVAAMHVAMQALRLHPEPAALSAAARAAALPLNLDALAERLLELYRALASRRNR